MTGGQVQVAVVGMGEIGRGWAALCAAAGWPVAVYDREAHVVSDAVMDIGARARALVDLERATPETVERGIAAVRVGRSLLETCGDATWVIEAVREDLRTQQKAFESIEAVADQARIVSSSSSGSSPLDIAGRCVRQERCLIAHPLDPPELIPLVELVPSEYTDGTLVELLKGWLRALGRIPVIIHKHRPGNVANRISAAVWREAIELVLEGVIDVEDLDRAVSLGPALGWAAAGPHLSYHLAAGSRGVEGFLQHLLHMFESIWGDLADWSKLDAERQHKLIHAIERSYRDQVEDLRPIRDARLAGILRSLERVRRTLSEVSPQNRDDAAS